MTEQTAPAIDFPQRLAASRQQHSLTHAHLAERIGLHVMQLRRNEAGTSQPMLDVILWRTSRNGTKTYAAPAPSLRPA